MSKTQLQQELLEKVKPGVKASDIKKQRQKSDQTLKSPSPIEIKDEGYSSSEEKPIIPKPPITPNQTIKDLQNQIQALQNQLQLYKDFHQADLKIKEQLKETITNLQTKLQEKDKTILELKNLTKPTTNLKETQTSSTQTLPSYFYCDNCQQTKPAPYILRKLDSPFNPRTHKKLCYLCSTCRKYTKEYNEPNFDPENNPYKIY